jgi:transcription elongation factor Elf1
MTDVNFTFDSWDRLPCKLGHVWPLSIHYTARNLIKEALDRGCSCHHDGPRHASLVQRNRAAWLQCDACGSSLGTAMRRDHHPQIDTYPKWRDDLAISYRERRNEHWDQRRAVFEAESQQRQHETFAKLTEQAEAQRQRRIDYEMWCRTAPEWAEMRKRILWRSRGHCEACLSGNAEVVHHLTYIFGKLPPAWQLRAVCASCHERLHTAGDE